MARGFGSPVHQRPGHRHYWVHCLRQGQEWWKRIRVHRTGSTPTDDALAWEYCLQYFAQERLDEMFLFPGARSPEEVDWRDVLGHAQNQPFETFGEPAIQADLGDVLHQEMTEAPIKATA